MFSKRSKAFMPAMGSWIAPYYREHVPDDLVEDPQVQSYLFCMTEGGCKEAGIAPLNAVL